MEEIRGTLMDVITWQICIEKVKASRRTKLRQKDYLQKLVIWEVVMPVVNIDD